MEEKKAPFCWSPPLLRPRIQACGIIAHSLLAIDHNQRNGTMFKLAPTHVSLIFSVAKLQPFNCYADMMLSPLLYYDVIVDKMEQATQSEWAGGTPGEDNVHIGMACQPSPAMAGTIPPSVAVSLLRWSSRISRRTGAKYVQSGASGIPWRASS